MKPKSNPYFRPSLQTQFATTASSKRSARVLNLGLAGTIAALLATQSARAASTYYFDVNGTTAGSGVTNAGSYSWAGAYWDNGQDTGTAATQIQNWSSGANNAVFVATADAGSDAFTVSLAGTTWIGAITVNSGDPTIAVGSANFVLGAGSTWTIATGSTLNVTGNGGAWGALNLNGSTLTVAGGGNMTVAGMGNSSAGLNMNGTGTLTLSAGDNYTGATTINSGTVSLTALAANNTTGAPAAELKSSAVTINAGGTLSANSATSGQNSHQLASLTLNGGTLASNGVAGNSDYNFAFKTTTITAGNSATSTISASIGLYGSNTFNVGTGSTLNITGDVGNWEGQTFGTINKTGAGLLSLTYNGNGYGGLTLSGGTVSVGAGGWGNSGSGIYLADFESSSTLQWAGTNTYDVSGSGRMKIADGVTATLDTNGNDVTLGTAIAVGTNKTGALTKIGAGTLTLSAAETYTGTTTVNGGRLVFVNNRSGGSNLAIGSGATLEFNNASGNIQQLSNGSLTGNGTLVKSGAGNLLFGANGQTQSISMTGGLIDVEGGLLRNEYTKGDWTNNKASLNVAAGATVDLWDSPGGITVDALTGGGTITHTSYGGTENFTIGVNNGSGTFTGTITNQSGFALNLVKDGSGTQVLNASNSYTGATTINGGTISLTGLAADATTGAPAAELATTAITINTGATLSADATTAGQNSHKISHDLTLNGGTLASNGAGGNNDWNFAFDNSAKIIAGGGTTSTISATIGLNGLHEINVGSGSTLDITGHVSNWDGQAWGSINKTGPGTLILVDSSNGYAGLTLNGGTVSFAGWGNLSIPGDFADFESAATLQFASGNTFDISQSGKLKIADGVTATFDTNSNNVTFNTAFQLGTSGAGAVTKAGTGTLTLTAANTYSGATNVNGGTLQLDVQNGLASNSTITVASGATLMMNAPSNNTLDINTVLTLNGGTLSAAGGLTASGNGGTYNYGHFHLDTGGSIVVGANTGTSAITSLLTVNGRDIYNDIGGFSPITVGANSTLDISGFVGGAAYVSWGGISKYGPGTLKLTGGASLGAGTVLEAGTLEFTSGSFPAPNPAYPTYNGGRPAYGADFEGNATLQWAPGTTDDISSLNGTAQIKIGDSANATFDTNGNNVTLATAISVGTNGTGALTKIGAGTLALSAANTYSGATTVANGTLSINTVDVSTKPQSLGMGSTLNLGAAGLSSGILQYTGSGGTFDKAINVLGNGLDSILNTGSGLLTLSGTITNNGTTVTLGGTGAITVGGTIAGSGSNASSLIVSDTGLVTLSTGDTYDGTTTVEAGSVLEITSANALGGTAGGTEVLTGGALELSGGITVGAEALSLSGTGIGNSGALRNVSGTNAYGGTITLAADSRINADAGSTLTLTGGITGAYNLTIGGAGNTDISGAISTNTLTWDGTGTLTLSGTNTFTGTCTVSAGILQVTGITTVGSAVEVQSAATLAGAGTLGGNITVDSGGHLAYALAAIPADQTTQTISGSLTLGNGNIIDLSAANAPASGTYVLATASGGITGMPGTVNLPTGVTGTLSVSGNNLQLAVTNPVSGFSSWVANYPGLSDTTPTGNPAHDGISNLMKYALGLDPTKAEGAPGTYTGNAVSFTKGSTAAAAGDVTYTIETSPDLVTWTAQPTATNTATTISYTLPTGQGNIFARLVVTQP